MLRRRARSLRAPLDGAISERLLGRALVEDVPEPYRRLAGLVATVTAPATPTELAGETAAAAAFVAVHDAATRSTQRRTRSRSSVSVALATAAVVLAASIGTSVAAIEGALPAPVQAVAHETLGVVGIGVPGIRPEHPDPLINRSRWSASANPQLSAAAGDHSHASSRSSTAVMRPNATQSPMHTVSSKIS